MSPESCKELVTMDDSSVHGISEVMDLWHLPYVCRKRHLLLHWLRPALIFF